MLRFLSKNHVEVCNLGCSAGSYSCHCCVEQFVGIVHDFILFYFCFMMH